MFKIVDRERGSRRNRSRERSRSKGKRSRTPETGGYKRRRSRSRSPNKKQRSRRRKCSLYWDVPPPGLYCICVISIMRFIHKKKTNKIQAKNNLIK